MVEFSILPPPELLRDHIECFRVSTYGMNDTIAFKVCPTGHPEIVFQHRQGQAAIKNIRVNSGRIVRPPLLFLHGQVTEVAIMNFRGPYTTVQVVLKPFGLQSLFGLNAAKFRNHSTTLDALLPESPSVRRLERQLIDATSDGQRIESLSVFLGQLETPDRNRDLLVEKSINLIERNISTITVELLLDHIGLSERQFERRFVRGIGVTPQFYVRVRRVNEAFRLMDTGRYERLSEVAYALNFYDQSHFIREVKMFSGMTPKSISQRVKDFHSDLVASSYVYR